MSEMLEAALAYAARGWPVFPCAAGGAKPKAPLIGSKTNGWDKLATTDAETIRRWWRRYPDALIGLSPGRCGLFVIDLDPKGEPVETVRARLEAAIGVTLPTTCVTVTQSGGWHVWMRRPDPVACGLERWGNGRPRRMIDGRMKPIENVDVRADEGYVIAPPSRMANGREYRLMGDFDAVVDMPDELAIAIAEAQTGLFAADEAAARVPHEPPPAPKNRGEERWRKWALSALDHVAADVASTSRSRGTALYAGACRLGAIARAGGLSRGEVVAALTDAASRNGLMKKDGAASVARDIERGLSTPDDGTMAQKRADILAAAERVEAEWQERQRGRGARVKPPAIPQGRAPADRRPQPAGPVERGEEPARGDDAGRGGDEAEPASDAHGGGHDDGPPINWDDVAWCAGLDQSDTDNARRLKRHFGRDILVRKQSGGREPIYVTWVGTHWDDETGRHAATRIGQQLGRLIKAEAQVLRKPTEAEKQVIDAAAEVFKKDAKEFTGADKAVIASAEKVQGRIAARADARRKFGVSSKNGDRINKALAMLAPHVLIEPEAFNADPLRLATPTQTLIFHREIDPECPDPSATRYTARLEVIEGHRREDLITRAVPFSYDPAAKCPRFEAFLERFQPVPEVRRYVLKSFGLGLIGLTEQVLVFHYGEGANGKSVCLEVIGRVLGNLASQLPAAAVASADDGGDLKASPEIARLYGKRFVRIGEIKEGAPLHEDFVKRITGSESFPARNLFEGFFDFKPEFIAHMTGNGYPKVSGTDNGMWRRPAVVKWPVVLAKHEQRNFENVVAEFMEEAPGILRLLTEGALLYLVEGLVKPPEVMTETDAFRNEMDSVSEFARAAIKITDNDWDVVKAGELYKHYELWAESSGLRPVTQARFGRDIKKVPGIVFESDRIRAYRRVQLMRIEA